MGAAAWLHPTTQQMPQAPAPCSNPDLVPSTSTEFTLKNYSKANCEQPPLRGLPSRASVTLPWAGGHREQEGVSKLGSPTFPPCQVSFESSPR